MFKRIVLIVLDGVGCGALPDAGHYGDAAANTLAHVAVVNDGLCLPTMQSMGLGNVLPLSGVDAVAEPCCCWGKMAEVSTGKDSTTGHWEMAGAVQQVPFTVYPEGFPPEVVAAFTSISGKDPLGNVVASGTEVLVTYGEEHLATARPIVYTSSDSVFQIAAHEAVLPPEKLYALCRQMREVLNDYGVGRVIARPFIGSDAATFTRTSRRRDFSMPPPRMLLDVLADARIPVVAVGKIYDIFCGRSISRHYATADNAAGMQAIEAAMPVHKSGLVFANLIDYDMLYGHRCDAVGFAAALERFDQWLQRFCPTMNNDDLLVISADHGCDPTTSGSDHSREYVPLLVWSPSMAKGVSLGVRSTFSDVAATVADNFSLQFSTGESFLPQISTVAY